MINQLKELRLGGMTQCLERLIESRGADSLSFTDGLGLLLQAERDLRKENRNTRLIKNARFRYNASVEELIFDAATGIDKTKITQLATCEYIKQGIPVIITGATGTGKSYLGTALGYQACLFGYKVAYFGMQKLFEKIDMARIEAVFPKFFDKMAQTDLLIIDDFGMKTLQGQQLLDFLELIEDRHARKATIMISQLHLAQWYDMMEANTTAADAILDRIVHTAQRFEFKGESKRKNTKSN